MMAERVAEDYDYVLDFPLLSDPGAAIINRYGLFNSDDSRGRAIPHPTTYVIDMDGRIHWNFTEIDYRTRPENEDILAALSELEGS